MSISSATLETILTDNVAHFPLLTDAQKAKLRRDTLTFVKSKYWEGCRGLQITDEMRVTIAAQACLMFLGLNHDCFRRVRTILVYPTSFRLPDEDFEMADPHPWAVSGQAVAQGPVILAWDSVLAEGRDPSMGANLVIHEFAHQLDMLDGYLDGTMDMAEQSAQRWNDVLQSEFQQLTRDVRKGRETFLGAYAATNKTEFFAVASERFFTLPLDLRKYHPPLFAALVAGYAIDPCQWFADHQAHAAPAPAPELWSILRLDDNGHQFLVETNLEHAEAERRLANYQGLGHKQHYWIERVG